MQIYALIFTRLLFARFFIPPAPLFIESKPKAAPPKSPGSNQKPAPKLLLL